MENPIKMDDLGVPLFSETSISDLISCIMFQTTGEVASIGGKIHGIAGGLGQWQDPKAVIVIQGKTFYCNTLQRQRPARAKNLKTNQGHLKSDLDSIDRRSKKTRLGKRPEWHNEREVCKAMGHPFKLDVLLRL